MTWTSDEQKIGGPGLLETVRLVLINTLNEFCVESIINDSNKLDEKLGIPHLSQCHDVLLYTPSYTGVAIQRGTIVDSHHMLRLWFSMPSRILGRDILEDVGRGWILCLMNSE